MPESLDALSREGGFAVGPADPTDRRYEYRITGPTAYELCATFDRDSVDQGTGTYVDAWSHRPGRQCFTLDAPKAGDDSR